MSAGIGCDLQHMQLYTRDDIRSNDESMPRSALRSLDDPYALSLKTSLLLSLSLRPANLPSRLLTRNFRSGGIKP